MKDEEILKNVYIDNPRFKNAVFNGGAVFEIIKVTRQAERKRIFELYDKVLEEWFKKWNRKIVTGRCLAELKALEKEVENEK